MVVISSDFFGKGYWERVEGLSDVIYEIFAPLDAVALTQDEWDGGKSFVVDFARNGEVLYAASLLDESLLIQVYRKFTNTCLYSRFSLYSALGARGRRFQSGRPDQSLPQDRSRRESLERLLPAMLS